MQGFLSRDGTPPSELLAAGARRGPPLRRRARRRSRRRRARRLHAAARAAAGSSRPRQRAAGHRRRRRAARRDRGRPRALGPRLPALPVLPRLGGPRPAGRRARLGRARAPAAPVDRRRDPVHRTPPRSPTPSARRCAARGIAVVDGIVERLVVDDDRLRAVQLADGRAVAREALFIRPALRANLDNPAALLGCELTRRTGSCTPAPRRPHQRARRLGGRQRHQPPRAGHHRRRRRLRRRDRDQHRNSSTPTSPPPHATPRRGLTAPHRREAPHDPADAPAGRRRRAATSSP